jgi:hypothetical protein
MRLLREACFWCLLHDEVLTFVSMMWVMGRVRAVMCWGLGAFDGGTAI